MGRAVWTRPPFWRMVPYDPREQDPAFWVIVLGGGAVISLMVGFAAYTELSALEYERERYPTTGGFWIGIAFEEMCLGTGVAVLLVLLGLYAVRHRPLD